MKNIKSIFFQKLDCYEKIFMRFQIFQKRFTILRHLPNYESSLSTPFQIKSMKIKSIFFQK